MYMCGYMIMYHISPQSFRNIKASLLNKFSNYLPYFMYTYVYCKLFYACQLMCLLLLNQVY